MKQQDDEMVSGYLNPLMMSSFEMQGSSYEDILMDLYGNQNERPKNLIEMIKSNYDEVSSDDFDMSFVPFQEKIIEKIIMPLFSAKKNFCLAN